MARITGYPDFSRLEDQEVAQQLKLVWDSLIGMSTAVEAIELPDTEAISADLAAETQLRERLGRRVTANERLQPVLRGTAFSSGQGNDATGADTHLAKYDEVFDANELDQAGDVIWVVGTFSLANNGNAKVAKLQLGGGNTVAIINSTGASDIVPFDMILRRRGPRNGSITGIAWQGAPDAGTPTPRLTNRALGSVNWTIGQTLKVFAASAAADDIRLTDYHALPLRGLRGRIV